jgi:hypothetical protein
MAISIDWSNKIIHIPKSDMQLVQSNPVEIRQLDLDSFRLILKDLEDSSDGIVFDATHTHVAPINVGGVGLARVVEFINNYTITFEDGQYAVNIVGGNTNLGDVVNVNQVSVRTSNSAGLVNIDELKLQSFDDSRIWINTSIGLPGTVFSRGTPSNPVDNPTDARVISSNNNLDRFSLIGLITLPNGESFIESDWKGSSSIISEILLNNVEINGSNFTNLKLSGACDGVIRCNNCDLNGVTNFKGAIYDSTFSDNLTIDSTNTQLISIIKCVSSIPGTLAPVIDMNNANCNLQVRDYFGGLELRNFNQGNDSSIDMSSGTVKIDSTCTSGTIVVRGICNLIDESGPGCDVITDGKITIKPLTKNQFLALQ